MDDMRHNITAMCCKGIIMLALNGLAFAATDRTTLPQEKYYAAGDETQTHGAWIRPFYEGGRQSKSGNLLGYKSNIWGLVVGFDEAVYPHLNLGLAFSYSTANVKLTSDHNTHDKIVTRLAMLYGTYGFSNSIYIDCILSGGQNFTHGQRTVKATPAYLTATGRFDGNQYSVAAAVRKKFIRRNIL
ncbi:MAG TPA: autotransporter outer membrane beta-barrel domain-containing protein, partial [Gammaproteobacteria bacterium]|nr:autotransporter outer membrane beta-barrel domain-containing protein [Gammaproteobacteria bacterium]